MSPIIERLEPRSLYSAFSIEATRVGDTLQITGTPVSDLAVIKPLASEPGIVAVAATETARPLFTTPLKGLRSTIVVGGSGSDEVRTAFSLHTNTHTRAVESRRVYVKGGQKLTGELPLQRCNNPVSTDGRTAAKTRRKVETEGTLCESCRNDTSHARRSRANSTIPGYSLAPAHNAEKSDDENVTYNSAWRCRRGGRQRIRRCHRTRVSTKRSAVHPGETSGLKNRLSQPRGLCGRND